jgi:hypothetical protein
MVRERDISGRDPGPDITGRTRAQTNMEVFGTVSPGLFLQLMRPSPMEPHTLLDQVRLQRFRYDESVVAAVDIVAACNYPVPSELSGEDVSQLTMCIARVLVQARLFSCACLRHRSQQCLPAVLHLLQHPGRRTLPCSTVLDCIAFYEYENRFPTESELTAFQANTLLFEQDAMDYTTTPRLDTPSRGLGHVLPVPCPESGQVCGICQEDISPGLAVYKLSCTHCFHAEAAHCLGAGQHTVLHWFHTNTTCPVCRQVVEFS